ncbi:MAG: hypothetical protein ACKVVT_18670 [Dehalococcoidia bacterium]
MRRDLLLMTPAFVAGNGNPFAGSRRSFMLRGALIAIVVAVFARVWMRTVSDDHQFTVGGTTFIVIVFAGMGAVAGLAFAWRRLGSQRRGLIQRGAGLVPFVLMGPFMLLFLPSLGVAACMALSRRRRWLRRAIVTVSALFAGFLVLAFLSRGAVGPLSVALYAGLAYVMFLTLRIAFAPLRHQRRQPDEALGIWLHY